MSFRFHDPISPAYFGRCLNHPQVELFKFRYICFIRVLTTADLANIFGRWGQMCFKDAGHLSYFSHGISTSQVMAEAIPPQQNHCSLAFAFPFGHLSGFQLFDRIEKIKRQQRQMLIWLEEVLVTIVEYILYFFHAQVLDDCQFGCFFSRLNSWFFYTISQP